MRFRYSGSVMTNRMNRARSGVRLLLKYEELHYEVQFMRAEGHG
jgi:hypothetical protein